MIKKISALICACMLLGGCSIIPPPQQIKYYSFEVTPPVGLSVKPQLNSSIQVFKPNIVDAFSGQTFFAKLPNGQFIKSSESRLLAPSNDIIGNIIINWFQSVGPWKTVISQESPVPGTYSMNVRITQLYLDILPGKKGEVHVAMSVQISNQNNMTLVLQKNVSSAKYIAELNPENALAAYNKAIEECLMELTTAIQKKYSR